MPPPLEPEFVTGAAAYRLIFGGAAAAATAAATLPALLAYNVAPSPTFLNQALALALWGGFVIVTVPLVVVAPLRGLLWALGLVAMSVLMSWGPGFLPRGLALSALGLLAAAALVLVAGAGSRRRAGAEAVFAAFCWGWLVAGLVNVAIALVQVFAPTWPDGDWLAASGLPGRAVGNLRQPNHLSSLLMWSALATVALAELGRLGRRPLRVAAPLVALMIFAVVLTASRTGLASVLLLAIWGLLDRRLSRGTRGLLIAAPLIYALAWLGMAQWAELSKHAFGGAARLAESDISGSRFGIWKNTLALIAAHPWSGVGFGEFNLAWTLTPFPGRPTAFFDHTHNMQLQLLVELGLPLGTLVIGLLVMALWTAWRRARAQGGALGQAQMAAWMLVLMIGLHSQFEYPLWYSYFLLPAAWAWGFALAGGTGESRPAGGTGESRPAGSTGESHPGGVPTTPAAPAPAAGSVRMSLAGGVLAVAAIWSVVDFLRVAVIFSAPDGAAPLARRIEDGRRSWLFGHHADYAAVTSGVPASDREASFATATHYLLDTRLMMAWAEWLAGRDQPDRASHLAARLREFRKPETAEFFARCNGVAAAGAAPTPAASAAAAAPVTVAASSPPFQCRPPARAHDWREFRPGAGSR